MKNLKVGLQLHGVRDALASNFEGTLKAIKEMGYEYVEFAGGLPKSAEEIKEILDKYGLKTISIHWDIRMFDFDTKKAIEDLKILGVKYSANPGWEPEEFRNNWDETIKKFTRTGELLAKNDLKLIYHNHSSEFEKIDGEYVIDKFYKSISEEYISPQFDTCWIHFAGENPSEYLLKYAGRIKVVHLKDFICKNLDGRPIYEIIDRKNGDSMLSEEEAGFEFTPVGYGMQDWKSILEASVKAGAEYVIVEQDESVTNDPLGDAKKSRDYLKNTFGI